MGVTWGADLLSPLPRVTTFSEGATEPQYVLGPTRNHAIGQPYALWASEVGLGGWQVVSLRALRGARDPDIGREDLPHTVRKVFRPLFDSGVYNAVMFETADGLTHVYANVALERGFVALLEVHLSHTDPTAVFGAAQALAHRTQQAWSSSRYANAGGGRNVLWRWIMRHPAVPVWAGAALVVLGTIGIARTAQVGFKASFVLGFSLALVGVTLPVIRGWHSTQGGLADRASALWRCQWAFASPAAAIRFPAAVAFVAVLLVEGGRFSAAAALVLLTATMLLFLLGYPRAVKRTYGHGLLVPGGPWREIDSSQLPAGFPTLPRPAVAAARHAVTGDHAAVVRGRHAPVAKWTRWQQQDAEWSSPRGAVTARAFQLWDGRPEAVVHAQLPDATIVVESGAGSAEALARLRQLTDALTTPPQAHDQAGSLPRVRFERFPAMVGAAVGGLLVIYVMADSFAVISTFWMVRLVWFTAVLLPLYAIVLNAVAVVIPAHADTPRRIWGLFLTLVLPVLVGALFIWAFYTPWTNTPVRWSLGLLVAAGVATLAGSWRAAGRTASHRATMVQ